MSATLREDDSTRSKSTQTSFTTVTLSITDLPDDCLLLIFRRLTLPEWVQLRVTCTRWRRLLDHLCLAFHWGSNLLGGNGIAHRGHYFLKRLHYLKLYDLEFLRGDTDFLATLKSETLAIESTVHRRLLDAFPPESFKFLLIHTATYRRRHQQSKLVHLAGISPFLLSITVFGYFDPPDEKCRKIAGRKRFPGKRQISKKLLGYFPGRSREKLVEGFADNFSRFYSSLPNDLEQLNLVEGKHFDIWQIGDIERELPMELIDVEFQRYFIQWPRMQQFSGHVKSIAAVVSPQRTNRKFLGYDNETSWWSFSRCHLTWSSGGKKKMLWLR